MSTFDVIFGHALLAISALAILLWAVLRLTLAVWRTGRDLDTFLAHERATWHPCCEPYDQEIS